MQHSVTKRGTRISTGINCDRLFRRRIVFKHSIFGCSKQREQWNDKVLVEIDPVPFKVDTGAEVTALIVRRYI